MIANHGNPVLADIGHFGLSLSLLPYCLSFFSFSVNASLGSFTGGVEPSRSGRNAEEFETCKGLRVVWGRGLGAEGHARTHTPEKTTPLAHVAALDRQEKTTKGTQRHPRNGRNCSIRKRGEETRVKEQKGQGEEMGTSSTPGRPMDRDVRPKPGGAGTVEKTEKKDRESVRERRRKNDREQTIDENRNRAERGIDQGCNRTGRRRIFQ